ncbi:hypothetical protein JCM11641_006489 [Rhodosporidiobolus odoratus]
MAFLWGPSQPQQEFDQLLEKCTSPLLPSPSLAPLDLPTALSLSDLLRSSSLSPPQALASLAPKLSHDNPNVVLHTLNLLDVLIKNSGTQFNSALAAGAASSGGGLATELELLASGRKKGGGNRDVQTQAKDHLQQWALAFKASGRDALLHSELVRVYDRLSQEPGVEFPRVDEGAGKAMVESLSAPDWLDSPLCTRCRTPFSLLNRKHHCRNCGQVFDAACSSSTSSLPHYGIEEKVRVCDSCARRIREGTGAKVARELQEQSQQQEQGKKEGTGDGSGRGTTLGRSTQSGREREDEDLKKAIEASLAEAAPDQVRTQPTTRSGYNPSYSYTSTISEARDSKAAVGGVAGREEEDPDLAAAIAASLRDLAPPPASAPDLARTVSGSSVHVSGAGPVGEALTYSQLFPRSSSFSSSPYNTHSHSQPPPPVPPPKSTFTLPNHDLPPASLSLLHHFSSLPPHVAPRQMYDDVRGVEPGLIRSLGDTRARIGVLKEMEGKLAEAARVYGAGLTERVSYRHAGSPFSNPYTSNFLNANAMPAAPVPPAPLHAQHLNPRYLPQQVSYSAGQPLPSFALPLQHQQQPASQTQVPARPPQPLSITSPSPVQRPPMPVPAGYYKPSHFPAVPQTNLPTLAHTGLETLPAVPAHELQKEEEEEEEGGKVGELIEF